MPPGHHHARGSAPRGARCLGPLPCFGPAQRNGGPLGHAENSADGNVRPHPVPSATSEVLASAAVIPASGGRRQPCRRARRAVPQMRERGMGPRCAMTAAADRSNPMGEEAACRVWRNAPQRKWGSAMKVFAYTAVSPSGDRLAGQMESDSREAVLARLQELGHFPVDIREARGKAAAERGRRRLAVLSAAILLAARRCSPMNWRCCSRRGCRSTGR